MAVEDLFTWYQKKIGTYDKQTWETTVEQRILYGYLPHVQMKSTKPNTDFIDLDLVRGSPCSKSKPRQGFMTVAKLATLRCVLLPIYSKWWMQQTSVSIFVVMFCLYLSQLVNIAIYYKHPSYHQYHTLLDNTKEKPNEGGVMCMELIVPLLMMWVLSLIHSQIAAAVPASDQISKLSKSRAFRRKISLGRTSSRTWILDYLRPSPQIIAKKGKKINFNLNTNSTKSIRSEKTSNGSIIPEQTSSHNNINETGSTVRLRRVNDRTQIDDGFESLNGNGSRTSEEESNVPSRLRCDSWVKNQVLSHRNSSESRLSTELESDDEVETEIASTTPPPKAVRRPKQRIPPHILDSTCDTDEEFGYDDNCSTVKEVLETPSSEWRNFTTNSEDLSYSSDYDDASEMNRDVHEHAIFNPPTVKASCTIWNKRNEIKKAELSTLDISSAIIGKVESSPQCLDYFYLGLIVSTFHALIPVVFRLCNFTMELSSFHDGQYSIFEVVNTLFEKLPGTFSSFINAAFGSTIWERTVIIIACLQRFILSNLFFFLLAVAETTFKQRFLYAKLFSHLTSFSRAKQSDLPHFRLNKVRNIKTWLSVRSYLKQRGPQRSVDVIVSTAFVITLLLLSFLCVELLKETGALNSQYHVEALIWCIGLGILLLRFMTLGNKINKKYRNFSVLITEQINLHLQIEQKPQKKEELTLANNVLKLAIDLIKELQSPFKISGLSANSILYNTTKLIILSALSGILSEILGFKLKLHKIKIK